MRLLVGLAVASVMAACGAAPDDVDVGGGDDDDPVDGPVDEGADADAEAPADPSGPSPEETVPEGPCPAEMAFIEPLAICVDRWEGQVEVLGDTGFALHSPYEVLDDVTAPIRAISRAAVVPQGYISGEQAQAACEGANKRLCTLDEYREVCEGPSATTYPYGDTYARGVCNEGRSVHPVVELFETNDPSIWDSSHMNDPRINQQPDTVSLTGARTGCTNGYGAFDMVGNLHEWVAEPSGTFAGGFYVDAEKNGHGCLYKTTAHAFSYHDYSTGFRCCLTP